MVENAIVLFSGGQDSATCLVWALERFDNVETIGFNYGQVHSIEMEVRKTFLKKFKEEFPKLAQNLSKDHVIDAGVLGEISDTALTSNIEIEMNDAGLPNTFVPGRNLLFFLLASSIGYRREAKHLVGGMCETDYSGYPDCRDDTLKALQVSLTLGLDKRFVIHTPLMWLNKKETWKLSEDIGGEKLVSLIVSHTHTCYSGDRSELMPWGYGCGDCPACELRRKGWNEYNNDKIN